LLPPAESAFLPPAESAPHDSGPSSLLTLEPVPGRCRVVCFSPRHDLTLPELSLPEVEAVVATWASQTLELGALDYVSYVQVFENKGAIMGASNPHPHSQIWASATLPNEPAKELAAQSDYFRQHGRPLLLDYLAEEHKRGERVVAANDHFTLLVPFWAIWPFEVMIVAHRAVASLPDLSPAETTALADLLRRLTARYDNLFEVSFPYSMGFHQAPAGGPQHPEWVLHAHFYPPLLRSATVKKSRSSWSATSCWPCPSATSRPNRPPRGCGS
jgi:UDPglucose--hexose-1-phosphate uridylyltransferase